MSPMAVPVLVLRRPLAPRALPDIFLPSVPPPPPLLVLPALSVSSVRSPARIRYLALLATPHNMKVHYLRCCVPIIISCHVAISAFAVFSRVRFCLIHQIPLGAASAADCSPPSPPPVQKYPITAIISAAAAVSITRRAASCNSNCMPAPLARHTPRTHVAHAPL